MTTVVAIIVAILGAFGFLRNWQFKNEEKKNQLNEMEKDINPLRQAIDEHKKRVEENEKTFLEKEADYRNNASKPWGGSGSDH